MEKNLSRRSLMMAGAGAVLLSPAMGAVGADAQDAKAKPKKKKQKPKTSALGNTVTIDCERYTDAGIEMIRVLVDVNSTEGYEVLDDMMFCSISEGCGSANKKRHRVIRSSVRRIHTGSAVKGMQQYVFEEPFSCDTDATIELEFKWAKDFDDPPHCCDADPCMEEADKKAGKGD